MASDLEFGVDVDFTTLIKEAGSGATSVTKIVDAVGKMSKGLEVSTKNAKVLGDQLASLAATQEKLTKQQSKYLQEQTRLIKARRLRNQAGFDDILNQRGPGGGTLRDAELRSAAVTAVTRALNSTSDQIAATFKQTFVRLADKIAKSSDEAISAAMKRNQERTARLVGTYGNPAVVQARQVQYEARTISLTQQYGGFGSGADYVAAQKLVREKRAQDRANMKAVADAVADEVRVIKKTTREKERQSAEILKKVEQAVNQEVAAQKKKARADEKAAEQANRTAGFTMFSGDSLKKRLEIFSEYAAIGTSVYGMKRAVQGVTDLDDALKKFQAITETADTEVAGFKDQLLKLAETSRYSVADLTDVATILGQTGLSAAEVAKTLPSVTQLATASGSTLKEAVDLVASTLGAYNMEASRAAEVSNVMTAALNKTKLTMQQLGLGMSYSANIAREAGVGYTELTAILGGLAQAGIRSGSTLGTGVRQLIQDLRAPSQKLKDVMASLGITMADIDIKANTLVGVLDNLRSKGFGSAEAMRALDLRAAAAFSALSGQTATVKRLQEALFLTDAASAGAAKASESLYASFIRLGNTIVSILDKALSPAVAVFKSLVNALTAVLRVVSALGPVLPVLVTGLGALATAALVAKLAAVGPAIAAWAPAALASAGAITGLRAALTLLAAHPLMAAVGVGGAIAGGILFSRSFGTERLDQLKAQMNEYSSLQQQTETTLSSLDSRIQQLIDRREKLNNDPILRRTTMVQAQADFRKLGLSIDASETSIDKLIDAFRRLRDDISKGLPGTIEKRLRSLREEIALLTQQAGQANRSDLQQFRGSQGLGLGRVTQESLQRRNQMLFGGRLSPLVKFLDPNTKVDPDNVMGQTGNLWQILNREKERTGISPRQKEILDALTDLLSRKEQRYVNLQAKRAEERAVENDRVVKGVQASRGYQSIKGGLEDTFSSLNVARGFLNQENLDANQKSTRITEIMKWMADAADIYGAEVDKFAEQLKSEGKTKEQIDSILGGLRDKIQALRTATTSELADLNSERLRLVALDLERRKKAERATFERIMQQVGQSTDQQDIALMEEQVKSVLERQREIEKAMIKNRAKNPQKLTATEQAAMDTVDREFEEKHKQAVAEIAKRRKTVTDLELSFQQKLLKAQLDNVQSQIDALEKLRNNPKTTYEKVQQLNAAILALIDKAKSIAEKQAGVQLKRDTLKFNNEGGSAKVTQTSAQVAQGVAAALKSMGSSQLLGTALRFIASESNFKQNAVSSAGARGLFQFLPSTWNRLGGGDINSIPKQVERFIQYLKIIENTFQKVLGRAPANDFERWLAWNQGEGGATKLLGANRNALASKFIPIKNLTANGVSATATVGEALSTLKAYFDKGAASARKHSDIGIKYYETRERAAKKRDAEVEKIAARDEARKKRIEAVAAASEYRGYTNQSRALEETLRHPTTSPERATDIINKLITIVGVQRSRRLDALKNTELYGKSSPAQRSVLEKNFNEETAQRLAEKVQEWAKLVGDKFITTQQTVVKDLQARLNRLKENPSKAKPGELDALTKSLEVERKKLETLTPLLAKQREVAEIERWTTSLKEKGLLTEQAEALLLDAKKPKLEEINRLRKEGAAAAELANRQGTYSGAIAAGSRQYFINSGQLNGTTGQWKSMTDTMAEMWTQAMASMEGSMSQLFINLSSGTMKAKDAFRTFAQSVIQSLMQIVSKILAQQILRMLFSSLGGDGGLGSFFGNLFGGGARFAQGGFVRAANGYAVPTRDSVQALLQPGEYVLRKSAVDMVGRDTLDSINALGNRTISANPPATLTKQEPMKETAVNVWVVKEDQIPPPGPRDIIATIAQDIETGGPIRHLIRTVRV